jgi:hypothetical protein
MEIKAVFGKYGYITAATYSLFYLFRSGAAG